MEARPIFSTLNQKREQIKFIKKSIQKISKQGKEGRTDVYVTQQQFFDMNKLSAQQKKEFIRIEQKKLSIQMRMIQYQIQRFIGQQGSAQR